MSRKLIRRLLIGFGVTVIGNGLAILFFGTMPESGVFYHETKTYVGCIWVLVGFAMVIKGSFQSSFQVSYQETGNKKSRHHIGDASERTLNLP